VRRRIPEPTTALEGSGTGTFMSVRAVPDPPFHFTLPGQVQLDDDNFEQEYSQLSPLKSQYWAVSLLPLRFPCVELG
jgi:hypothetical protein